MLKLLIADYDEICSQTLAASLGSGYEVRQCHTGTEALEILRTFRPNILILDLLLPEIDGISLLQQAADEGIMPMVLTMSRFISDYIADSLNRLGVSYLMSKPCETAAVIARLADFSTQLENPIFTESDPKSFIAGLLLSLNVPTKRKGYFCLREAILLMAKDPNQSVTKEVYPAVAKMMGGSVTQVERLIRSAIEKAWKLRDPDIWDRYFPELETRPTNRAMISRLADCINLKYMPK